MQSVSSFWQRLVESELLGPAEAENLQAAFASIGLVQDANAVAEWLINQKKISRYQATGCLTGAYTSFRWGDFLRTEPIDSGPLQYQWRAQHIPSGQRVILVALRSDSAEEREQLAPILDASDRIFTIQHPLFAPCELMYRERVVMAILIDRGGTSLSRILAGGTRLSVSQSASIAAAIATDLQHLHAAGLVHGHVYPETIWIPSKGEAQLLHIPPDLSTNPQRGSLEASMANYAAPELQPHDVQATIQSDLYALGCTLFEMLCGHVPFVGNESIENKMRRHAAEAISPLQMAGAPEGIDQIVRYLMGKNIGVRYQSAATVAETLQPFIAAADQAKERVAPEPLQQYIRMATGRREQELIAIRSACLPVVARPSERTHRTNFPENAIPSAAAPNQPTQPAEINLNAPSSEASQAAHAITLPGPDARRNDRKRSSRRPTSVQVILGVALLTAIGITISLWKRPSERGAMPHGEPNVSPHVDFPELKENGIQTIATPEQPTLVEKPGDADPSAIWDSPTHGMRPQLRYLAPGPKVVLSAHLVRSGSVAWQNVLRACNLKPADLNNFVEEKTGFRDDEIDRLDIGLYAEGSGVSSVWVCYLTNGHAMNVFESRWKTGNSTLYAGEPIYSRGERCFYKPSGKANVFCVGNKKQIEEIIDWLGEETRLDEAQLKVLELADGERDINLLFDANFIRSHRDPLYTRSGEPIHNAIAWLLGPGEHIQAGLLSLNLEQSFFCELLLFCSRDKQPRVIAKEIYTRLQRAPSALTQFLLGQSISDYSRATLAVTPDMLRSLARYTRFDRDQPGGKLAILRSFLPASAAAHMALAVERLLDEVSRPQRMTTPKAELSFEQRLKKLVSLSFDQDNLRSAIRQLSQESGIAIKIIGQDLELEGITQNQSFGISLRQQPTEKILVEILKVANPEKNASLADDSQKLIYVIKQNETGKKPTIWVTTRAAATSRGDSIPHVFVADK